MRILTSVLGDIARLRLPVTAAAVLATILALTQPLGLTLGGDDTAAITGALVAVGIIATYLQRSFGALGGTDTHDTGIVAPSVIEQAVAPRSPGTYITGVSQTAPARELRGPRPKPSQAANGDASREDLA